MDTNTAVLVGIGMVCLTVLWVIKLIAQNSAERLAGDAYKRADDATNDVAQLKYRMQEVERKSGGK